MDDRHLVSALIDDLGRYGEVAIFGGMLRDLTLGYTSEFRSDVDLVVRIDDQEGFDTYMESLDGISNAFGGRRVTAGRWIVDLWGLEDTWAARTRHRQVEGIRDLVETTFFNWDGVAYNLHNRELHTVPGYFEAIHHRLLDINFEPNPSPFKMALRALRLALRRGARLSPRLTRFVWTHLQDPEGHDDRVKHLEVELLVRVPEVVSLLARHMSREPDVPLEVNSRQLELGLPLALFEK